MGKHIICLPGVPGEMQTMMDLEVIPYLARLESGSQVITSRTLKILGPGEAEVERKISHLIHSQSNPTIAPLVSVGEVMLRVTAKAHSQKEAHLMIDKVETDLRALR